MKAYFLTGLLKMFFLILISLVIFSIYFIFIKGDSMNIDDFFTGEVKQLIQVTERHDQEAIKNLLNDGVSYNVYGNDGITPLFYFMTKKDKPAFKLALKSGADPDFPTPEGDSPLSMITGGNDPEWIRILLEAGANPNMADHAGNPPLFNAVTADNWREQVDLLLAYGADINMTDTAGSNAAHHASDLRIYDAVFYLIEKGADYNMRDKTAGNIAWNVQEALSSDLINPESEAYENILKVKQQLIDRGVEFPVKSPREYRIFHGIPNRYDLEAMEREKSKE